MVQQHPLSFFIEFAENNPLKLFKDEFFANAGIDPQSITYDINEEWRTEFNLAPGGEEAFPYRLYFKDYLATMLDYQRSLAIQQLDLELINEPNIKKAHSKLAVYSARLDGLKEQLSKQRSFKKYPAILNAYVQLQEQIDIQAESLGLIIRRPNTISPKESKLQLQWTSSSKALAQLFFYLINEEHNNGKPFIKADKIDVARWLHKNFKKPNGQQLEVGTLADGLKPRSLNRRSNSKDIFKAETINEIIKRPRGTKKV
jgi:hypothetical protein